MTKYSPGDAVIVEFQGVECEGEVIRQSSGFVMARIAIPDVELDMGAVGARLDPQPLVCVPESRVRAA
jgi:hypothetical protein